MTHICPFSCFRCHATSSNILFRLEIIHRVLNLIFQINLIKFFLELRLIDNFVHVSIVSQFLFETLFKILLKLGLVLVIWEAFFLSYQLTKLWWIIFITVDWTWKQTSTSILAWWYLNWIKISLHYCCLFRCCLVK